MNGISSILVREARAQAGLTQRDLAARAGTTQSVVGRIEAGIVSPRVETVVRLLEAAGFRPTIRLESIVPRDAVVAAYAADIDRTLLRENLARPPEARVRALQELHRLASEAQRAGKSPRRRE